MGARARGRVAGMGKREETRPILADVVSRYERAGQPRKVFAANHKVGLAALQVLDLQAAREAEGARRPPAAASSELRLVPVRVAPQTTATFEHAGRVEVRFGGLSIRVPMGSDPPLTWASVVAAMKRRHADAAAERAHIPGGRGPAR